MRLAMFPR